VEVLLRGPARGVDARPSGPAGVDHPHTKFECDGVCAEQGISVRTTPGSMVYRPQFSFRTTDVDGVPCSLTPRHRDGVPSTNIKIGGGDADPPIVDGPVAALLRAEGVQNRRPRRRRAKIWNKGF